MNINLYRNANPELAAQINIKINEVKANIAAATSEKADKATPQGRKISLGFAIKKAEGVLADLKAQYPGQVPDEQGMLDYLCAKVNDTLTQQAEYIAKCLAHITDNPLDGLRWKMGDLTRAATYQLWYRELQHLLQNRFAAEGASLTSFAQALEHFIAGANRSFLSNVSSHGLDNYSDDNRAYGLEAMAEMLREHSGTASLHELLTQVKQFMAEVATNREA
jgi:hypothetical protein